jgi:hypothetical protein
MFHQVELVGIRRASVDKDKSLFLFSAHFLLTSTTSTDYLK